MLVSFRVKNFKSIVDATLDLRYGEGKAPNGYAEMDRMPFLQADMGENAPKNTRPLRVVPVLAIYGQNAGGKTTLAMALTTFRKVVFSLDLQCEELNYEPNKLHPELEGTDFCIDFITHNSRFVFQLTYDADGIRSERLVKDGEILYEIDNETQNYSFSSIATEDYAATRIQSIMEVECQNANGKQVVTMLGKIGANYAGLNEYVSGACQYLYTKTSVCKDNELSADDALYLLSTAYQCGSRGKSLDKAFAEVVAFMSKLDLGIRDMKLSLEAVQRIAASPKDYFSKDWKEKRKDEHMSLDKIFTFHKASDGQDILMRMSEESRGTQLLFGLLAYLLIGLKRGGVVFIDELDRSIHPLVLKSLVSLFTDRTYNKHNAQLIFTAHNTELLDGDELRLSEVGIVTKTAQDGTQLRRLCDFEGVRNVKNFRLGYLDGYFSGIPFLSI